MKDVLSRVLVLAVVMLGVTHMGTPWYYLMAAVLLLCMAWSTLVYAGSIKWVPVLLLEVNVVFYVATTTLLMLCGELFLGLLSLMAGFLLTGKQWRQTVHEDPPTRGGLV